MPGLCGQCQKYPPTYTETIVPFEYSDPIAHYIHLLKYQNQLSYATTLGLMLATHVVRNCRSLPDALVPVPLYNSKLRQRGFNQAKMIAQTVGRLLEIQVDDEILKRIRNTNSQTSLELPERRKNMHNAFAVTAPGRYDSVAVVDDVITSGATINAACSALKRNDYNTISAWSIAKT
jgi:ComF family protein